MSRTRPGPQIEMTPDGQFIEPPRPPLATRVLVYAVLVAFVAGGLVLAGLLVSAAIALVPIALVAAGIAYAAWRWRLWQLARGAGRRGRQIWRP
ncbi:conserved protein of unknown function [Rhodovastum atsumiense]|uniref:Uncharacterized protein n=1 Tax=Rhodovastum atsumiense TaxID=504468 RepID=A0A5M6IR62_9PROT|nr:hypothetical protein [Rhodovastum atsumiense]KAA5610783.1 hypothetical protein F1189_17825 [Rhodovastum atsumiense]CAH2604453.1 conserved protein of unknown function [Rhodovastum atsumiense]